MTLQIWLTVAFFVLCGAAWLLARHQDRPGPPPEPLASPAPPPPPPPPAPPKPVAVTKDYVTIQFVSQRGRPLGSKTVERKSRRPSMQHRLKNGTLANFVCVVSAPDGKTFVYRRVSEDRE